MFEVEKVRLVPLSDDAPRHIKNYFKGSEYQLDNRYGTFRNDTKENLGVVTSAYDILQNQEMLDIAQKAADVCGLDADKVVFKELRGGKRVAFQVDLPSWVVGTNDTVKRYLTILTSHDGSTGTAIGNTGIRVFCNNAWTMAYKALARFRHTASGNESVRELAEEMLIGIEQELALHQAFEDMNRKRFTDVDIDPFIKRLLGYTVKELEESGRKAKRFETFTGSVAENLVQGQNAWQAFNGVTYVTNHVVKSKDRDTYLTIGGGNALANKAFKLLQ